jgi:cell division protein FtsW (lipid II flippase)
MRKIHFGILIPVLLLLTIGWLLVFSSSAYFSMARSGDAYFYIRRHSYFIIAGLVLMTGAFFVNYRVYLKPGILIPFVIVTFVLMILTLIIGHSKNRHHSDDVRYAVKVFSDEKTLHCHWGSPADSDAADYSDLCSA